jgi:hypothetical protein
VTLSLLSFPLPLSFHLPLPFPLSLSLSLSLYLSLSLSLSLSLPLSLSPYQKKASDAIRVFLEKHIPKMTKTTTSRLSSNSSSESLPPIENNAVHLFQSRICIISLPLRQCLSLSASLLHSRWLNLQISYQIFGF